MIVSPHCRSRQWVCACRGFGSDASDQHISSAAETGDVGSDQTDSEPETSNREAQRARRGDVICAHPT